MGGQVIHSLGKIILGTFNFLIFVCGVLLLAFGILALASPQTLTDLLDLIPGVQNVATIISIPQLLINSAIYMIILGSIMVVFGFAGCFGIMRHSPFLLLLYWSFLIVLLLAEIGLIIFALVDPYDMETDLQNLMLQSLEENFKPGKRLQSETSTAKIVPDNLMSFDQGDATTLALLDCSTALDTVDDDILLQKRSESLFVIINPSNGDITLPPYAIADAWISMQFEVGCCGALGPSDYKKFTWNNTFVLYETPVDVTISSAVVPPSCCQMTHKNTIPTNINDGFLGLTQCLNGIQFINTVGCYNSAMDLLTEYGYIAVGIAAAIIFFQLIAIGTAMYEWKRISKK